MLILHPPNADTYSASVTFIPTDSTNDNTVSGSVKVAFAKAALTVTDTNFIDRVIVFSTVG
jgi:hypothetical protein